MASDDAFMRFLQTVDGNELAIPPPLYNSSPVRYWRRQKGDTARDHAATRIQAVYRGYRGRKRFVSLWAAQRELEEAEACLYHSWASSQLRASVIASVSPVHNTVLRRARDSTSPTRSAVSLVKMTGLVHTPPEEQPWHPSPVASNPRPRLPSVTSSVPPMPRSIRHIDLKQQPKYSSSASHAAVLLQRVWRGCMCRRRNATAIAVLRRKAEGRALRRDQLRQWETQRQLLICDEEVVREEFLETESSRRSELGFSLLSERNALMYRYEFLAACRIQRVWRGFVGREYVRYLRYTQITGFAATRIQRIYRGFRARRWYNCELQKYKRLTQLAEWERLKDAIHCGIDTIFSQESTQRYTLELEEDVERDLVHDLYKQYQEKVQKFQVFSVLWDGVRQRLTKEEAIERQCILRYAAEQKHKCEQRQHWAARRIQALARGWACRQSLKARLFELRSAALQRHEYIDRRKWLQLQEKRWAYGRRAFARKLAAECTAQVSLATMAEQDVLSCLRMQWVAARNIQRVLRGSRDRDKLWQKQQAACVIQQNMWRWKRLARHRQIDALFKNADIALQQMYTKESAEWRGILDNTEHWRCGTAHRWATLLMAHVPQQILIQRFARSALALLKAAAFREITLLRAQTAVIKIQRRWRLYAAAQKIVGLLEKQRHRRAVEIAEEERICAALQIQGCWRAWNGRKQRAARKIQQEWKRAAPALAARKQTKLLSATYAVSVVQRAWRCFTAKKIKRKLVTAASRRRERLAQEAAEAIVFTNAAVQIQRTLRGHITRAVLQRDAELLEEQRVLFRHAAVTRRMLLRQELAARTDLEEAFTALAPTGGPSVCVAASDVMVERLEIFHRSALIAEEEEARAQLKKNKLQNKQVVENAAERDALRWNVRHAAATDIQRVWRGHCVRTLRPNFEELAAVRRFEEVERRLLLREEFSEIEILLRGATANALGRRCVLAPMAISPLRCRSIVSLEAQPPPGAPLRAIKGRIPGRLAALTTHDDKVKSLAARQSPKHPVSEKQGKFPRRVAPLPLAADQLP
eukprot:TRINITY_DN2346_c0_g1_i1.p1 TRINITY_DN2346_c0_g1~~TRINITY_DN2346_c0_g1_i1.p1  ORF type:complete len:1040 (-),score=127.57 TRINITY_DN2346_c0_g1_i1:14-3133(-)